MGKHTNGNHSIEWGKLLMKHVPGKHVGTKQPTKFRKAIQFLAKRQETAK